MAANTTHLQSNLAFVGENLPDDALALLAAILLDAWEAQTDQFDLEERHES